MTNIIGLMQDSAFNFRRFSVFTDAFSNLSLYRIKNLLNQERRIEMEAITTITLFMVFYLVAGIAIFLFK